MNSLASSPAFFICNFHISMYMIVVISSKGNAQFNQFLVACTDKNASCMYVTQETGEERKKKLTAW
jgi:hypothetical protein